MKAPATCSSVRLRSCCSSEATESRTVGLSDGGTMKAGIAIAALALLVGPLGAQGRGPKRYAVSKDRAVVVTREVLGKKGFEVVRVETVGNDQVVWYRAGNRGRGRGKGPPMRMVIRREPGVNRIVLLETRPAVRVERDVR